MIRNIHNVTGWSVDGIRLVILTFAVVHHYRHLSKFLRVVEASVSRECANTVDVVHGSALFSSIVHMHFGPVGGNLSPGPNP